MLNLSVFYKKFLAISCSQVSNKIGNIRNKDMEARSHNHFCRRKALSITYSEREGERERGRERERERESVCVCVCVYVASVFQREVHEMYHIVVCGLSGCTMFIHNIS